MSDDRRISIAEHTSRPFNASSGVQPQDRAINCHGLTGVQSFSRSSMGKFVGGDLSLIPGLSTSVAPGLRAPSVHGGPCKRQGSGERMYCSNFPQQHASHRGKLADTIALAQLAVFQHKITHPSPGSAYRWRCLDNLAWNKLDSAGITTLGMPP